MRRSALLGLAQPQSFGRHVRSELRLATQFITGPNGNYCERLAARKGAAARKGGEHSLKNFLTKNSRVVKGLFQLDMISL